VNVVPWYNVEFDALPPPYIQHNSKTEDGFGDFSMLLKYRLAAGNEANGNYSVSFSTAGTLPTGKLRSTPLTQICIPSPLADRLLSLFGLEDEKPARLHCTEQNRKSLRCDCLCVEENWVLCCARI
jgi:hypothetical protein